jgi:phospholipase/carboxylesterase
MLLLLHGVGSNERDLLGLAPDLDPRLFVVSARAPHPMGPDGYAWFHFDILPDGGRLVDHDQAESSRVRLLGFIDELAAAYPVDRTRVYVAGFSQGAMMAASLALTAPSKLAGAVLMSGRILPEVLERHAGEPELRGFPVLVVHGTNDQVLPIANGRASRDALSLLPVKLAYAEFPMAHEVSRASLRTVADWLRAQLDAKR